jgi:hypothetical protein
MARAGFKQTDMLRIDMEGPEVEFLLRDRQDTAHRIPPWHEM